MLLVPACMITSVGGEWTWADSYSFAIFFASYLDMLTYELSFLKIYEDLYL